jgi:hypothetical protein
MIAVSPSGASWAAVGGGELSAQNLPIFGHRDNTAWSQSLRNKPDERPVQSPMSSDDLYILGINAYDHDVSACLLRNGEIAVAVSKERITRYKHDTGFYGGVVDYCLEAAGISRSRSA